ncbi:MAG: RNA polymerase sigma factor [Acidobacteriota bacterium]
MFSATVTADADLMARLRAGDREALGDLVERHQDALVNYLTRLTGRRERGEELAQEAFVRLLQAVPRYREEGKLLPYLYRIATNLARSEDRRERRFRFFALAAGRNGDDPAPAIDPAGVGTDRLLREETQRVVGAALAALPLRFRVPVTLYAIEGWSYEAIAETLGTRVGTVKSRIHRGRERLRERLAPYWQGGPQ